VIRESGRGLGVAVPVRIDLNASYLAGELPGGEDVVELE
jgi:hypothetical protein